MLNPRRLHAQRGSVFYEWVVFFPLLVALVFTLIFFSRLGVISERSQSAVRYGDLVSWRNGQAYTVATVESVIDEILHINSNELGPLCLQPTGATASADPTSTVQPLPTGVLEVTSGDALPAYTPMPQSSSIANRVAADTQAALVQAQVVGTASPVASAKPYWRPDQIATSQCNPASIALQSGSYGVGNLPVSVQSVSISSSLNIPSYLSWYASNGFGGFSKINAESSAQMGFLNVATPNLLIACVPGLNIVLTILQPATAGKAGPPCPGNPVAIPPGG
jgi:hypothetical protein